LKQTKIPKTDYSQVAKYFDRVRPLPSDVLISKIIEYGKLNANHKVLDVGCGTGRFPLRISDVRNVSLCALEPSIEMLKQAVRKDESRRILWVRGDGQRLPFQDKVFDCVYMTAVIHHIENKEMVLQEIYRILKTGGRCAIMTFSHSRIKKHVTRDFPGVVSTDLKRVPSVPSLKKMMTLTGFREVAYHVAKVDEGYVSTDYYLNRVRNKYISTLSLLSEDEFKKGLKIFEERIRRRYGSRIRYISWFVFLVGRK
jgi:SAM-dependent methyltransferase